MSAALLLLWLLWRPSDHHDSRPPAPTQRAEPGHTLDSMYEVDLERSYVEWTGTKFRGRGKHEGLVRLRSGELGPCSATRCRGRFVLDMHNLEITDIPKSDAVPRRRLLEHLRSRDFFWTERYPESTFVLAETRIAPSATPGSRTGSSDSTRLLASGLLTLRGTTQSLAFPVRVIERGAQHVHLQAEVVIDRQRWGISYRFDPIRNEIVDDEITLVITVVARARSQTSERRSHDHRQP